MNTMLRRSGAGLAVLAVVMLLAACQSTTGRTLGENIDDAGITTHADKPTTHIARPAARLPQVR